MSRPNIDLTKPLSDEDRAYLEARDDSYSLDLNALHLMGGGADEAFVEGQVNVIPSLPDQPAPGQAPSGSGEDDTPDESEGSYKGWLKADWENEIGKRNAERPESEHIVPNGSKATDLKAAILADDEAHKA